MNKNNSVYIVKTNGSSGDELSESLCLSSVSSKEIDVRCIGVGADGLSMVFSSGGKGRSLVIFLFPPSLGGCNRICSNNLGLGPGMFSNDLDNPDLLGDIKFADWCSNSERTAEFGLIGSVVDFGISGSNGRFFSVQDMVGSLSIVIPFVFCLFLINSNNSSVSA